MPLLTSVASLAGLGLMPAGDFESIATITVGAGGASSIEFTSIPGTYQHLQVRMIALGASVGHGDLQINGDTGNNYAGHELFGTGSAAGAQAGSSRANIFSVIRPISSTATAGAVIDILDYASTSKNKTVRIIRGTDTNGGGEIGILSGLWMSASAITSLKITGRSASFAEHSTAALYGIKA